MPRNMNLDVDSPEKVLVVLRNAVDVYYDAAGDLESAWGDPGAGKPWEAIAKILDRAITSMEKNKWLQDFIK